MPQLAMTAAAGVVYAGAPSGYLEFTDGDHSHAVCVPAGADGATVACEYVRHMRDDSDPPPSYYASTPQVTRHKSW